jgi:hypothetical protein
MHADLPVQSIAAIATLVAGLVTGAISFVNLILSKEQKTSEFRQAWIDGLREDLAQFLGAARAFARAIETVNQFGADYKEKVVLPISDEKISDLRYQAAETLCKIQLRLNPDEPEHVELLRLLRRAIEEQNAMLTQRNSIDATMRAIEVASEYARPVLKKEWERVKLGERPFRIARNLAAWIVFLLLVAFVMFVWNGAFRI